MKVDHLLVPINYFSTYMTRIWKHKQWFYLQQQELENLCASRREGCAADPVRGLGGVCVLTQGLVDRWEFDSMVSGWRAEPLALLCSLPASQLCKQLLASTSPWKEQLSNGQEPEIRDGWQDELLQGPGRDQISQVWEPDLCSGKRPQTWLYITVWSSRLPTFSFLQSASPSSLNVHGFVTLTHF